MYEKIQDRCWDYLNMSPEELFDRYCDGDGKSDPIITEGKSFETRQYKNTRYWYMIVDCIAMPGIRLANVWDSREDD